MPTPHGLTTDRAADGGEGPTSSGAGLPSLRSQWVAPGADSRTARCERFGPTPVRGGTLPIRTCLNTENCEIPRVYELLDTRLFIVVTGWVKVSPRVSAGQQRFAWYKSEDLYF